jgi:2-desacetyl-2-hydroxyethyl bacteriochlorophyllide A dehydrogenase
MRAAVYHGPGRIEVTDVAEPASPGEGEVVVRVRRAAICGTDATEWDHGPVLARPPVVLGHEFTGEIVDAGQANERFSVGDRVVSGAGVWCGACEWCRRGRTNLCESYRTLGLQIDGGLAEYVAVPTKTLVKVPDSVSDDAAAIGQPLAVALHAVRRSRLARGESSVIVGAGGIGAFIVAAAARVGASPVIALDVDDDRLGTARRLGATDGIAVNGRDLAHTIRSATGGIGPDVLIESTGAAHVPAAALGSVKRGGRVLIVGLQGRPLELDILKATVNEIELTTTLAHVCEKDLPEAVEMLATSDLAKWTIDRTISLSELVDVGIRSLVDRTARGKIVVDPWS